MAGLFKLSQCLSLLGVGGGGISDGSGGRGGYMGYSSIPSGVEAIFLFASDISDPENYNRFNLLMV